MLLADYTPKVEHKTGQTLLRMKFHKKLMPNKLKLISFTILKKEIQRLLSLQTAFLSTLLISLMV
jgi:hypothetical protein